MKRKVGSLMDYFDDIDRLSDNLDNNYGRAGSRTELLRNLSLYLRIDGNRFKNIILKEPRFLKRLEKKQNIPTEGKEIRDRKTEGPARIRRIFVVVKGKKQLRYRDKKTGRFTKKLR